MSGLARIDPKASHAGDVADGAEITLALSQGVPFRIFTLTDPDRLVLDFREVDWQGESPGDLLTPGRISAIRFGPFRPGWSRMVADLATPMKVKTAGLSVDSETGRARLKVVLMPQSRAAFDAGAGAPDDPAWDLPPPAAVAPPPDGGRPVVVIDPGHGGIDPGAQREGAHEADLMLTLAREVRDTIRRAGFADVVLTRDSDIFVPLETRVSIAHRARADAFVSLHADAIAEGEAHGATVYRLAESASDHASAALAERHDRDDLLAGLDLSGTDDRVAHVLMDLARLDNGPRSLALAKNLVASIGGEIGNMHKKPLRQAGFSVLKSADIPSVLIEVGFLSTQEDLDNLQDPAWRARMAGAIADGIAAWMRDDAARKPLRLK